MDNPDRFYILTRLREAAINQKWMVQNQKSYEGNLKISLSPSIGHTIHGYLVLNGLQQTLEDVLQSNLNGHSHMKVYTLIRVNELNLTNIENLKSETRGISGPTLMVTNENLLKSCKDLKCKLQTRNLIHVEIPNRSIYYGDDDKWVKSQYPTSKRGLKKIGKNASKTS